MRLYSWASHNKEMLRIVKVSPVYLRGMIFCPPFLGSFFTQILIFRLVMFKPYPWKTGLLGKHNQKYKHEGMP